VPGHAGITVNEETDEEAKQALEFPNSKKYPPEDGLRRKSGQPTKKVGREGECNE
jgi:hypothetical protein